MSLPKQQAGFILTLELLLITTILIIGSFVGLAAIRDSLVKRYVSQQNQEPVVLDAVGRRLGKPVDYDEHDAPRIAYIDTSIEPAGRVLIGVRDDRFTSREPVYYSEPNCTGTPCMKGVSDEATDSVGVDGIAKSGAVSYLNALQGGPNYAIGRADDGVKGFLYREQAEICPVEPVNIRSRWLSQSVTRGEPCQQVSFAADAPANTDCIVDDGSGQLCSCPAGYSDQGDIVGLYAQEADALLQDTSDDLRLLIPVPDLSIGSVCCPAGTTLDEEADLPSALVAVALNQFVDNSNLPRNIEVQVRNVLSGLTGTLNCKSQVNLRAAESVPSVNAIGSNALQPYVAPFSVTAPVSNSPDQWRYLAPRGEGLQDAR